MMSTFNTSVVSAVIAEGEDYSNVEYFGEKQLLQGFTTSLVSSVLGMMWWPGNFPTVSRGQVLVFFQQTQYHYESYGREANRTDPLTPSLFVDLILYVPSTILQLCRGRSSWVEPVLS